VVSLRSGGVHPIKIGAGHQDCCRHQGRQPHA